jgi:hypothetical protein
MYNVGMNNYAVSLTEREAVLMVNTYGVEVALKVAKNQEKFYQMNPIESDYWKRIIGHLLGIQNRKYVVA